MESGEVTGVVLVLHYGPEDHRAGVFGEYKKNPAAALRATFVLDYALRGDLSPQPGHGLPESATSCPCRWHIGRG